MVIFFLSPNVISCVDQVEMSSMPRYEFLSVELANSRTKARVKLTLPPVLRHEEEYKFPLIVHV
jgi:hypothetical protein